MELQVSYRILSQVYFVVSLCSRVEKYFTNNIEKKYERYYENCANGKVSHTYFYKVIDVVRQNNIPVRHFSYASARKCAEQIVLDDLD